MENLRLIAGLGNPGSRYERTRHNAGFLLVERLAKLWRASWSLEKKFQARVARVERNGLSVMLCQPQTFMNASGESLGAVVSYYQLALPRLIVAVDDADLPFGELRLRERGSSGGHHGLESVERHLGSRDFTRQRIGIGRTADDRREITDYVLAPFSAEEAALAGCILDVAAAQIECWLDAGIGKAMSQFNGVINDSGEPSKGKN